MPQQTFASSVVLVSALTGFSQAPPLPASPQRDTASGRPELVFQVGHSAGVTALAISDSAGLFATGSYDNSVRLWDTRTGFEVRRLGALPDTVLDVTFSRGGDLVAALSDNLAVVWDARSGTELKRFAGDVDVSAIAFGDVGHRMIVVTDRRVREVDLDSNVERTPLAVPSFRIKRIRYNGTGIVGVGHDGSILIGDMTTGSSRTLPYTPATKTYLQAAAISDNGLIVARKFGSATLELVDLPAGTSRRWPKTTDLGAMNHLQFGGQDSSRIYADDDRGHIVARDAMSGDAVRSFEVPESGPLTFAVSADEGVVIGSSRLAEFWMAEFDGLTAVRRREWRSTARPATSIAFAPDGKQLLSGHEVSGWLDRTVFSPRVPTMTLWDLGSGLPIRQVVTENARTDTVAFHSSGREIVGASADTVGRWNGGSGNETARARWESNNGSLPTTVLDPRGETLARIDQGGRLTLVSVASPSRTRKATHDSYINSLGFSADGSHFATWDQNGMACAWSTRTARRVFCAAVNRGLIVPRMRVPMTVTNDGRWLFVEEHEHVEVFDTESRKRVHVLDGPANVTALASASAGRSVVVAYANGTIRVWDMDRQADRCSMRSGGLPAFDLAMHPGGDLIAAAAGDGTIRLWSCRDQSLLVTLFMTGTEPHRTVADVVNETIVQRKLPDLRPSEWLAIAPDGLFDGTAEAMSDVTWRVAGENRVVPLEAFFTDFYRPGLLAEVMAGGRPKAAMDIAMLLQVPGLRALVARGRAHLEDRDGAVTVCFAEEPGVAAGIGPGDQRVSLPTVHGYRVDRQDPTCPYQRTLAGAGTSAAGLAAQLAAAGAGAPRTPWDGQPSDTRRATLHVLAVGVTAYPTTAGLSPLPYAVPSAQAIEATLRASAGTGGTYAAVRVWDGLYDANATRQQIRERLRAMSDAVKPDDVVVLYLAGHGRVALGEEMFYFLPVDGRETALRDTALNTAMLAEALRNLPARRVMMFLDACQSGGAIEALEKIAAIKARVEAQRAGGTAAGDGVGVYLVAATLPLSYAVGLGDQRSALASTVLAALAGDDPPTARGLVTYIEQHLPSTAEAATGFRQVPLVTAVGLDFPLRVR